MKTVVVGNDSNLSRHLRSTIDSVSLVSARQVLAEGPSSMVPVEPFRLVFNNFQPATALRDLQSPISYIGVSIEATAKMLEAVAGSQCVKIVYTSSASVYGDDVDCREGRPPKANDLHSALKVANEKLVEGFCERAGIDCTIARVFNMYGGEDNFSIVSKILKSAASGSTLHIANHGNAVRDFVHIDDVIRCYRAILRTQNVPIVNVASGVGISVRTILDTLRLYGHDVKVESRPRDEIRVSTADVSRLARLIDVESFTNVLDHVLGVCGSDHDRRRIHE